jgi:hypothetical protein
MAGICECRFFGAAIPFTFLFALHFSVMVAIFSCTVDPLGPARVQGNMLLLQKSILQIFLFGSPSVRRKAHG